MEIKDLLNDRIQDELAYLGGIDATSEEYTKAVDGVTKLLDRAIELEKISIEDARKAEVNDDERKDRIVKNIISVAGIAVPIGAAIWGTIVSIKFEEKGTITTIMGRGWINKLIPKK